MNMGIEPFLVATSVNLIQAQRLIRRTCKDCKKEHPTPVEALVEIGFAPDEAAKLKTLRQWMPDLQRHGYKGRIGLYEAWK